MKQFLRKVADAIIRSTVLKYGLILVFGLAAICLLGENSLYSHLRNRSRIAELQAEISGLREQYKQDKTQLRMLDSDPKSIQKIARERYFMKADDEDIFVISEEE